MTHDSQLFLPYLMVGAGAALWGAIGIFIEALDRAGFTPLEMVALRVATATVMLLAWLLVRNPSLLRIDPAHLHYFIGTGIVSICFFNWCYFTAIKETSLSVAVILLYTGPAFVALMARVFFSEPLTMRKGAALALTFGGAALVVELFPAGGGTISAYGILTGLGAGFGYALYSIFGKTALTKYRPVTIIFYTFLAASLFMLPFSGILNEASMSRMNDTGVLWMVLGLGFFPTVLAYLLYTEGLSRIEAGRASITAMLEPVAATLIGVTLFGEVLSVFQLTGIALVLSSVLLIREKADGRREM